MRVLLDTNVVLDLILEREPFVNDAAKLWELHQQGEIDAYISPITAINVFYITRKLKGRDIARQAVNKLLRGLFVCPTDAQVLQNALTLPFKDFEDAVQHAAATAIGLQAIITRDSKDYSAATLLIHTPMGFLKTL